MGFCNQPDHACLSRLSDDSNSCLLGCYTAAMAVHMDPAGQQGMPDAEVSLHCHGLTTYYWHKIWSSAKLHVADW